MITYREAYQQGFSCLEKQGITEAQLDARLLLEYICKTDRNTLLLDGERPLQAEQQQQYEELIRQRAKHIPLQYLTGEQGFMGLTFQVNENVLIPRQDTEILVEEIMRNRFDGQRILDVCTGSGCILISLLKYSNSVCGIGCDISEPALEVARKNAVNMGVNAEWICSDLFGNISGTFDIIVSNPPYIEDEVIKTLMKEVQEHEPKLALSGGPDGLTFYRRIVRDSVKYLNPQGKLFFEIGCEQGEAVMALMKEAGYREIRIVRDYAGLDRVVHGTYGRNGE